MYRKKIGLNNGQKFGIEIEFQELTLGRLYNELAKNGFPVTFSLKHKSKKPKFDKWILDIDPTISHDDGERIVGGELSSRVLSDNFRSWDEIKKVCIQLNKLGGVATSNCGLHVTADISKYLDNPLFLETLVKLFFVYEDSIDLFFMGNEYLVRNTKEESAYNFRSKVMDVIEDKDLLSRHPVYTNHFTKLGVLNSHCGLNLDSVGDRGLIEVRYGNGTLDYTVIQNFCNFVLKVINAIENNNIDLDYLNFEIKCLKNRTISDLTDEDVDKFIELIKTISVNKEDVESLSKQYVKVLESKRKKI